jgi:uncharacterized membrane protein
MNKRFHFLRTTVIGGIVFLVPLVIVTVILGKAFRIIKIVTVPLNDLIPIDSVAGFAVLDILTVVTLLLCSFLFGLVARSPWGRRLYGKVDAVLLQMIPGYAWIKAVTGSISEEEADKVLKPVVARFDDQFQVAFEVDRSADGLVAVFLPGAPDPRSGAVSYVTADRVKPLDVTFTAVVRSLKNLGRDSAAIVGRPDRPPH